LFNAFPDHHREVLDIVGVGDVVIVRWRFTGTHKGELMGITPTDRRVDFQGISWGRYREGRCVESHIMPDSLTLLYQIGALES
jgi:predicted ester cyclase